MTSANRRKIAGASYVPLSGNVYVISSRWAICCVMDGLLNLFIGAELENAHQRLQHKIKRRSLRDTSDPFNMPDFNFRKIFHLDKIVVRRLIAEIRPFCAPPERRTAVPAELKILATLAFLAQGSYQTCIGENFNLGLSQKSISNCIAEITSIVVEHLVPRYVVFPQTPESRNRVKVGFMQKFNFPGVIGAIDGTHVAIKAPPTDHEIRPRLAYYNRKGFYSINVQIICDSNLNILNCNARFPGSCHDSAVWELSSVRRLLEEEFQRGNRQGSWLLGDSGYALVPWLLTPIIDAAENTLEGRYTRAHIRARNTVERCIGVMKHRFRCLSQHRTLHYDPVKAGQIIYTCAVLHNLANNDRDHYEAELGDEQGNENFNNAGIIDIIQGNNRLLNQGRATRAALIQSFQFWGNCEFNHSEHPK